MSRDLVPTSARGVEALLDGVRVDSRAIPLVDDGAVHRVHVVLGDPAPETTPIPTTEGTFSLGNSREP